MGRLIHGFFRSRWRGEGPLSRLLWRDTQLVGTLLNLASLIVTLVLMKSGAPAAVVALVHFSMLPYNLFLVAAVWRVAERRVWPRFGSLLWLGAATMV
jgi:hypothetical protein